MSDEKSFQYVKIVLPLFRAVVKLEPCIILELYLIFRPYCYEEVIKTIVVVASSFQANFEHEISNMKYMYYEFLSIHCLYLLTELNPWNFSLVCLVDDVLRFILYYWC